MDIFIDIALSIDRTIYTAIPKVYDLIIRLAGYEVFKSDTINGLSRRIYALLGIFMLFKLSFSMISYIVNPDDFSDQNKGIGKLVTNIVISLSLLILTPYIFSYAYQAQTIILEDSEGKKVEDIVVGDNVLAKIVDERDISHYLGHLIGAMKDNKMIPMMVSVQNIIKQEDHYDVYLKYSDLIYGISKVEFGRTLKVLETKRVPWWKGLTTIISNKST